MKKSASLVERFIDTLKAEDLEVKAVAKPGLSEAGFSGFLKQARQVTKNPKFDFPADYKTFMLACGGVKIGIEGDPLVWIYTPNEMFQQTKKYVKIPSGVTWENSKGKEVAIATDHLLAFAAELPEAQWCFDATAKAGGVYWHHQDEPLAAREKKTGAPITPGLKPKFASFDAWMKKTLK